MALLFNTSVHVIVPFLEAKNVNVKMVQHVKKWSLINLYKNRSVKTSIHHFTVGYVLDCFLAVSSDVLQFSLVAWQPRSNDKTPVNHCTWPRNSQAHNPP